jgi:hypothetical protein
MKWPMGLLRRRPYRPNSVLNVVYTVLGDKYVGIEQSANGWV